jgi:tripartite ATP-independent transporter DctM subunit
MVNFGLLMVVMFIILILLRVPIYISLLAPPILYMALNGVPLFVAAQNISRTLDSFSLLAVPLFIFVGALMDKGGIADRIFTLTKNLVGHFTGGVAYVNIVASMIFSGMSGSALADIGGIGRVLMNTMKEDGYSNSYSAALTSASATVGPLFPPSIPLIIYGVLSRTSVVDLLLAGLIPALLLFVALIAATAVIGSRKDFPKSSEKPSRKTVLRNFVTALPAIGAPVVLIYGMLSGLIGVTELATVTVVYMILVNAVFYGERDPRYIWESAVDAARTTSVILVLLAGASLFSYVITLERTAVAFTSLLLGATSDPILLLLLVNVMLLVLGLFLEPLSAMIISIPLVLPPLTDAGIDPVHIGVVMVFNLMIGLLTPPLGLSIYLASDIADAEITDTIRDMAPYYAVILLTLLVVTLVPSTSLWITNF